LEQRQPLELAFADSIVPQDRHEAMLVTGFWYMRHGGSRDALLTQKIEWGLSDQLQIATLINVVHATNLAGPTEVGVGDFEVGARYTWANVGSRFTHVAVAFDAGFPAGNPTKHLGAGAYSASPSLLLSHEFCNGRFQVFTTTGFDFVIAHRNVTPTDEPHHEVFSNSGLASRAGHGWGVIELSANSTRWAGGDETNVSVTPSYIWRFARRGELLFAVPLGLTSSTDHVGGVLKLTFELGGKGE
jgi:hypothetical protein